jgi:hypothetical protein
MEQVVFEAAMKEVDKRSQCVVWLMLDRNTVGT